MKIETFRVVSLFLCGCDISTAYTRERSPVAFRTGGSMSITGGLDLVERRKSVSQQGLDA